MYITTDVRMALDHDIVQILHPFNGHTAVLFVCVNVCHLFQGEFLQFNAVAEDVAARQRRVQNIAHIADIFAVVDV